MATVPVYQPRLGVPNTPTVRQDVQAGPGAFGGGVARATAGFGQDVLGAGADIYSAQKVQKERDDITAAQDAFRKANEKITAKAYTPGTGWRYQEGEKAKGITETATNELPDIYRESTDGLTPEAKSKFDVHWAATTQGLVRDLGAHEDSQMRKYAKDTATALVATETNLATTSYLAGDSNTAGIAEQRMLAAAKDYAKQSGVPPEQAEQIILAAQSNLHSERVKAMRANGQAERAVKYLETLQPAGAMDPKTGKPGPGNIDPTMLSALKMETRAQADSDIAERYAISAAQKMHLRENPEDTKTYNDVLDAVDKGFTDNQYSSAISEQIKRRIDEHRREYLGEKKDQQEKVLIEVQKQALANKGTYAPLTAEQEVRLGPEYTKRVLAEQMRDAQSLANKATSEEERRNEAATAITTKVANYNEAMKLADGWNKLPNDEKVKRMPTIMAIGMTLDGTYQRTLFEKVGFGVDVDKSPVSAFASEVSDNYEKIMRKNAPSPHMWTSDATDAANAESTANAVAAMRCRIAEIKAIPGITPEQFVKTVNSDESIKQLLTKQGLSKWHPLMMAPIRPAASQSKLTGPSSITK